MNLCVLVTVFLMELLRLGSALRCYRCINIETSSSTKSINRLIAGKSDHSCYPLTSSAVSTVSCPNDALNYKCGIVRGEVTIDVLVTKMKLKTQVRDCMLVPAGVSDGCHKDKDVTKVVNTALSFIPETKNFQVDGDVCYCSDDGCVAECSGFSFLVSGVCLSYWILIGGGLGLVALIITCCCCCCCCCCRRKSPPTQRFIVTPGVQQPGPIVSVTSHPGVYVPMTNQSGVTCGGATYSYDQPKDTDMA